MISAMSSTKNHPSPKKRQFGAVDFPDLPLMTLSATRKFAKQSQNALVWIHSEKGSFADSSSLYLPLISPHRLQQRFSVKQNSVFAVIRESYSRLKFEVETLDVESVSGMYVQGPVGIGKSHLLYILAAEFRLDRSLYRVTYINDCGSWRLDGLNYLLCELVTTFYDDSIEHKSIAEWFQMVTESRTDDQIMIMMNLMRALVNYVKISNLQWIVIADQHNALYSPSVVKEFPFNILNFLSTHRNSNVKVILSASANNEGYPTNINGYFPFCFIINLVGAPTICRDLITTISNMMNGSIITHSKKLIILNLKPILPMLISGLVAFRWN